MAIKTILTEPNKILRQISKPVVSVGKEEQSLMNDMLDTILTIIQIAPWVISGASLICALTPTPKDDEIIGKIYKLIDWCAINVGKAKEK